MSRPRNYSRTWPVPPSESTLHVLGDTHFGMVPAYRTTKLGGDLLRDRMMPSVVAHLQTGDLVEAPNGTYDATALTWISTYLNDAPVWVNVGNHEVDAAYGGTARTGSAAAAAIGMPGRDWVTDLGFARLISLGIETITAGWPVIDQTTLDYLDAQLAAAGGQDCWITSHAPLYNTVGAGGPSTQYRSTDDKFYYQNDAAIRAILADYPNAKAWISGHTHSPLEANKLISAETIGSHTVAAINASAIEYVGNVTRNNHPMNSLYLTHLDGSIVVRFRNHGAGLWLGPNGGATRVVTVNL